MMRAALLRYLHEQGCLLIREGKRHSVFVNQKEERTSTVPRHNEINNFLAIKICKDLGILPIKKSIMEIIKKGPCMGGQYQRAILKMTIPSLLGHSRALHLDDVSCSPYSS